MNNKNNDIFSTKYPTFDSHMNGFSQRPSDKISIRSPLSKKLLFLLSYTAVTVSKAIGFMNNSRQSSNPIESLALRCLRNTFRTAVIFLAEPSEEASCLESCGCVLPFFLSNSSTLLINWFHIVGQLVSFQIGGRQVSFPIEILLVHSKLLNCCFLFNCFQVHIVGAECRRTEDCYRNECCIRHTGSQHRFCQPLRQVGETCQSRHSLVDAFQQVYINDCPCAQGLVCREIFTGWVDAQCVSPRTRAELLADSFRLAILTALEFKNSKSKKGSRKMGSSFDVSK